MNRASDLPDDLPDRIPDRVPGSVHGGFNEKELRLLRRAQLQDKAAFGSLVSLHQSRVRGFLRRLCRNRDLADDLAQDTFIQAWRNLGSFTVLGTGSSPAGDTDSMQQTHDNGSQQEQGLKRDVRTSGLQSWLLKIAYNCFLQERRRSSRFQEVMEAYGREQPDEAADYIDINPQEAQLEQAMRRLNMDEAACITLCFSLGYSHAEAVQILGMPLGTVKSHINRGKEKLRVILTESKVPPA